MDELVLKSRGNKFQMNEAKCKELQICFAKSKPDFEPIIVNDKPIKVVTSVKLLGLNISNEGNSIVVMTFFEKKTLPRICRSYWKQF